MSGWQNDHRVKDYLDAVCAEIRWTEAHAEIRQELASHIADRTEAGLDASLSEADALAQAFRQMGDPALVGRQLDQAHRPQIDWSLIGTTLLLVLLGLWAMYAIDASGALPVDAGLLPKKLVWSVIGLAVATAVMLWDYRRLRRSAWPLFGVIVIGLLFARATDLRYRGYGHRLDLAPLLLAPALAGIFAEWRWTAPWARLKAAALFAIPTVALVSSASHFAALEYGLVFGAIALGTRPSWRQVQPLAYTTLALWGLLLTMILREDYRRDRLFAWANMYADPQGVGYVTVQSVKALRGAGAWGHGATAPLSTLPEIHSDFVFPYLVYTLGWVAGTSICLVLLCFVLRIAQLVRRVRDPFGALLVRGAMVPFVLMIGWNLLMTLGLMPLAAVDLPFVSHGGREVLYLAMVGLVLSISRHKELAVSIG